MKQNKEIIVEQEKQLTKLQQELSAEKSTSELEKDHTENSQVSNYIKMFLAILLNKNEFRIYYLTANMHMNT